MDAGLFQRDGCRFAHVRLSSEAFHNAVSNIAFGVQNGVPKTSGPSEVMSPRVLSTTRSCFSVSPDHSCVQRGVGCKLVDNVLRHVRPSPPDRLPTAPRIPRPTSSLRSEYIATLVVRRSSSNLTTLQNAS